MIDSHCHLDDARFHADRDDVLMRAREEGVEALIVPAVGETTWEPILRLADARRLADGDAGASGSDDQRATDQPLCYPALGIHPLALPLMDAADDDAVLARLDELVRSHGHRLVGLGECGLDSTIDQSTAPLERQERMLRGQLAIAREMDLPVVFHCRGPNTHERLLTILRDESLPPSGGVIHSYSGGVDFLKRFLEFPLFFGFAGPATWRNARKVRASIAAVPDDRLLAETDSPDQTPEPHRPGRNEPGFLRVIIEGLAQAREDSPEHIAELTARNARRLFRI